MAGKVVSLVRMAVRLEGARPCPARVCAFVAGFASGACPALSRLTLAPAAVSSARAAPTRAWRARRAGRRAARASVNSAQCACTVRACLPALTLTSAWTLRPIFSLTQTPKGPTPLWHAPPRERPRHLRRTLARTDSAASHTHALRS
eukprot:6184758-Pleurochrysis_carterae.AAC.4